MGKAEFSSDVVVANEYTLIGAGSIYGMITIDTVPKQLIVNAQALEGRTTIFISAHPDNSGYVYIGMDNTVSGAKWFHCLAGGSAFQIKVDNTDNLSFWAVGSIAGQKVGIMEGVS